MWRDKPASESTRVARYWDDLVKGALGHERDISDAEIDPTLAQTISWIERIDDAQTATAEFSRKFELHFLETVAVTSPRLEQSAGTIVEVPVPHGRRQSNHRELPLPATSKPRGFARDSLTWRRMLVPLAAAVLLVVSLVAIYYVLERREESQDTNVILAPSTSIDVPMDRGNPARSGVMPGPGITDNLTLSWSFEAGQNGISAPVVVGNTIFVTGGLDPGMTSTDQGSIIAIDAVDGSERWRFPTEHEAGTTPAVAGGIVYAGDAGGTVYALDAETGQERWRKELQSGWTSEPVVVDDAIFLAAAPYQAPLHVAVSDSTVVVGSGLVGSPADGFKLYAFDRLTGEERWHSGDDRSGQPGLFAFDIESGVSTWQFSMSSLESGPAIAGGQVYAGSTLDAAIYAIDLVSGEEAWRADIGEDLALNSSPAATGGSVFVTTAYGAIFCFDESSGEVRWQASAEHASVNSSAVVVGNTVYVVDTAFGVSAFQVTDGAPLWSEQLPLTGQVAVSPVVVNGTLYIGTSLRANTAYAATLWSLAGPSGR